MAMLEYNEIVERKFIVLDGTPYEVIDSHVFRKQQRKPVNATKLKNLISGKMTEQSFHVSEKVEEAEIDKKDVKFLFANKGEFWFCEINDPSKRFKIEEEMIGIGAKFMKTNAIISLLLFKEKIIGVKMPVKVELKVTEAQDATKGNTAQGATKSVTVETGATVFVPMFIKEGEIIRINTDTGEYSERVGNSF
ncbi:MAG: elongation factor P [Candidatus Zambryskibacteria bacterium]|nr:elongation factor P [Candidatus Zambryskibacteria bacterium]